MIKLISHGGSRELQNKEKKSQLNMGSPWFYKLIADKIIFQYLINVLKLF